MGLGWVGKGEGEGSAGWRLRGSRSEVVAGVRGWYLRVGGWTKRRRALGFEALSVGGGRAGIWEGRRAGKGGEEERVAGMMRIYHLRYAVKARVGEKGYQGMDG